MNVVGTIFLKDNKILLDKPRKRKTYQMIGGKVEDNEEIIDAAIRECFEELGNETDFDKNALSFVMDFEEIATSDPNLKIHFYVFIYNKLLNGNLTLSEEIENFIWYDTSMNIELSNTLKNEVIPYCKKKNYIK